MKMQDAVISTLLSSNSQRNDTNAQTPSKCLHNASTIQCNMHEDWPDESMKEKQNIINARFGTLDTAMTRPRHSAKS